MAITLAYFAYLSGIIILSIIIIISIKNIHARIIFVALSLIIAFWPIFEVYGLRYIAREFLAQEYCENLENKYERSSLINKIDNIFIPHENGCGYKCKEYLLEGLSVDILVEDYKTSSFPINSSTLRRLKVENLSSEHCSNFPSEPVSKYVWNGCIEAEDISEDQVSDNVFFRSEERYDEWLFTYIRNISGVRAGENTHYIDVNGFIDPIGSWAEAAEMRVSCYDFLDDFQGQLDNR